MLQFFKLLFLLTCSINYLKKLLLRQLLTKFRASICI